MFSRTTRRTFTWWLILALLFAQGLRVCLHVYDDSAHQPYPDAVASSHLESTFSQFGDNDPTTVDTHIPLLGLLKNFAAAPLVALVTAVLLIVLLTPERVVRLAWLHDNVPRPRFDHRFTPPLRAPPR